MGLDSLSLDAAQEALRSIPCQCSRADWIKYARILFDEFGDDGFGIWDAWSKDHPEYNEKRALQAWKSAVRTGGGRPATIATLVYDAKRNGWRPTRKHNAKRDASAQRAHEEARARRRAELQAAEAAAQAAAALRAAELWAAATLDPAGHPYLERKRVGAYGIRRAAEWVREWVDPETGEVHTWRDKDALIIPIWSGPGVLASLQAILPARTIGRAPRDGEKDQRRDKDYLRDGRKHGCYCTIGRIKPDVTVVIICEGYATGASLHEATGYPVMVAFDAGNLQPVAEALRAKLPSVRIVIASDNDQFHAPRGGKPFNPGVEAATAAAEACKGVLAVPQFESLDGEPTDFNDLAREQGADAVRAAVELALNPPAPASAPAPDEAPPWEGAAEAPSQPEAAEEDEGEDGIEAGPANNREFAIMGYDHGTVYVFVHKKRQLMELTSASMGGAGLLQIASLQWWEHNFPSDSGKAKFDTMAAANFLIQVAQERGIFDPDRVRGRGAWYDEGRIVYHHGDHLTVDGTSTDITAIKSRHIYELKRPMPGPADKELTSDEGEYLLDVATKFRWHTPGSAALLAGWVALAPVCGAMPWRPHVWLTAEAGGGKSTALNQYVHWLLGGVDVFVDGSKSTEPGIRQKLHCDARPVLIDEAESNEEKDALRMQNILALIRQSSTESGAQTYKGTAGGEALTFHVRSMFCLASIQVALKQKADIDRITVLALRSPTEAEKASSGEEWRTLRSHLDKLHEDETLPARLMRRSLNLLPITLQNVRVFSDAAADRFGRQRDGDQLGTLLAGAWSLISAQVATREQALEMIDRYDWEEHRDQSDSNEAHKALSALMEAHIRIDRGIEVTVYELLCAAIGKPAGTVDMSADVASGFLQRYGLKVKANYLLLQNSSIELKRLMGGTGFEADLRGSLMRVPGASKWDNKAEKFNGVASKVVAIPLEPIVGRLPAAVPF